MAALILGAIALAATPAALGGGVLGTLTQPTVSHRVALAAGRLSRSLDPLVDATNPPWPRCPRCPGRWSPRRAAPPAVPPPGRFDRLRASSASVSP